MFREETNAVTEKRDEPAYADPSINVDDPRRYGQDALVTAAASLEDTNRANMAQWWRPSRRQQVGRFESERTKKAKKGAATISRSTKEVARRMAEKISQNQR